MTIAGRAADLLHLGMQHALVLALEIEDSRLAPVIDVDLDVVVDVDVKVLVPLRIGRGLVLLTPDVVLEQLATVTSPFRCGITHVSKRELTGIEGGKCVVKVASLNAVGLRFGSRLWPARHLLQRACPWLLLVRLQASRPPLSREVRANSLRGGGLEAWRLSWRAEGVKSSAQVKIVYTSMGLDHKISRDLD